MGSPEIHSKPKTELARVSAFTTWSGWSSVPRTGEILDRLKLNESLTCYSGTSFIRSLGALRGWRKIMQLPSPPALFVWEDAIISGLN